MIIDWTHEEAVRAKEEEIGHITHDLLGVADEITIREAAASIEDEATRYHAELLALPCRLLGVLVVAEKSELITHDQMLELYAYVEAASGEYMEKRSAC